MQIDEAEAANTMFELCMGTDVASGRDLIFARGATLNCDLIDA